jgi:hypothetical protein
MILRTERDGDVFALRVFDDPDPEAGGNTQEAGGVGDHLRCSSARMSSATALSAAAVAKCRAS